MPARSISVYKIISVFVVKFIIRYFFTVKVNVAKVTFLYFIYGVDFFFLFIRFDNFFTICIQTFEEQFHTELYNYLVIG